MRFIQTEYMPLIVFTLLWNVRQLIIREQRSRFSVMSHKQEKKVFSSIIFHLNHIALLDVDVDSFS